MKLTIQEIPFYRKGARVGAPSLSGLLDGVQVHACLPFTGRAPEPPAADDPARPGSHGAAAAPEAGVTIMLL